MNIRTEKRYKYRGKIYGSQDATFKAMDHYNEEDPFWKAVETVTCLIIDGDEFLLTPVDTTWWFNPDVDE